MQVSRLAFDLGVADKSATFMRIDAHTLDLQDLRLAYRQAGNSRRGTGLGKQVPSPGLCAPFWAPGPPPWAPVHAALEWSFPSLLRRKLRTQISGCCSAFGLDIYPAHVATCFSAGCRSSCGSRGRC